MVNESLEEYFSSKRYRGFSKTITISSFKEQEDDNYRFWAHLTPKQRIELHYLMISYLFHDVLDSQEKDYQIKLSEES